MSQTTQSDKLERLRNSKSKYDAKQAEDGKAMGRRWATERAEYEELVNLNKSLEERGYDYDEWLNGVDDPTAWIMSVIDGEPGGYNFHRDEQDSLWGGIKDPCAEFVAAFAEGALEVFDEVQ